MGEREERKKRGVHKDISETGKVERWDMLEENEEK